MKGCMEVQNPENDDVLDPAPKSYRFHGEESKVYIDGQPIEPTKKGVDFRFIPGPNPHYDGKPIYWQKQSLAAQPDVGAFPQYYGQPRQQVTQIIGQGQEGSSSGRGRGNRGKGNRAAGSGARGPGKGGLNISGRGLCVAYQLAISSTIYHGCPNRGDVPTMDAINQDASRSQHLYETPHYTGQQSLNALLSPREEGASSGINETSQTIGHEAIVQGAVRVGQGRGRNARGTRGRASAHNHPSQNVTDISADEV
uniref:Uncharacterized protein n=1 Tax=Meloidogyne floridensis TaxID=298350 RepID=A0A915NIU1_9BILA